MLLLLCPPDMPSCKHSIVLDQSATNSDVNTTPTATDYVPPHEPLEPSNFVGFIIITTVIVFGLSLWGLRSFWAKRRGRKGGEEETGENKQKAEQMAEEWIKKKGGQGTKQTDEVLDITHMNEIEYGEGWKTTSSAQSRDKANAINPPIEKEESLGWLE